MKYLTRHYQFFLLTALGLVSVAVIPAWVQANPTVTLQAQAPTNANLTNLVQYLNKIGAKMYGTYWCPYCQRQKQMFGAAAGQINYIECDPAGQNPQPGLCQKAQIRGYPTWEINGKLYPGMRTPQQLAELSGYKGAL